jgi:NADH-quinone oxidoreductase subunit J
MLAVFYVAALVAVIATILMLSSLNAVHGLLYLILSLLAVSIVFYVLGAPFVAALEVIIYAGAIMVLFIFVVMLLNLGPRGAALERGWLRPSMWLGPAFLALVLLGEVGYLLATAPRTFSQTFVEPKQVGLALFGPYLIGVELASLLLLAAVVGAYHIGFRRRQPRTQSQTPVEHNLEGEHVRHTDRIRADARDDLVRTGADRDTRSP